MLYVWTIKFYFKKVNAMTKIVAAPAQKVSSSFRAFIRDLVTIDPAIRRSLDNTYVSVQLNNRIWMV